MKPKKIRGAMSLTSAGQNGFRDRAVGVKMFEEPAVA